MADIAWQILVTCEHATNRIPSSYRRLFAGAESVLGTHRAHDPGALALARILASRCKAPLRVGEASRLLVELNRSLGHPGLWSEFTRDLPQSAKDEILARYYHSYREGVIAWIKRRIGRHRRVLHLSIHSFTPVWEGQPRAVDIGLLYDPRRAGERALCGRWKQALEKARLDWRVRRNQPYRGVADGFATHLRKTFGNRHYAGIELEVTQALSLGPRAAWVEAQRVIAETLSKACGAGRDYERGGW